MIYINDVHINTVQAVNMIMKFPGRKIYFFEKIAAEYIKNPNNIEVSLAYGFYKYLDTTQIVKGEDLANTDILGVVEIYDRILKNTPDDWFVHMLKVLLYSKLPNNICCHKDKQTTLAWMLAEQNKAPRKEPYFILPYIFYSEDYVEKNEFAFALKLIENGMNIVPHKEIMFPTLNPYLFFPIEEFYFRLYFSEHFEFAKLIKGISTIYFPSEAAKLSYTERVVSKA